MLNQVNSSEKSANEGAVGFIMEPPTPEEFLTEKYLGANASKIYPRVREAFLDFFEDDVDSKVRHLIIKSPVGWGATYLGALSMLYVTVCLECLEDIHGYFRLCPATGISQVIMIGKDSRDLALEPYLALLEGSPLFKEVCNFSELADFKGEGDVIRYVRGSKNSFALHFPHDLDYVFVRSLKSVMTSSVIMVEMSHPHMMLDEGMTDEQIMGLYYKLRCKMNSHFNNSFFSRSIVNVAPSLFPKRNALTDFVEETKDFRDTLVVGEPLWLWDDEKMAEKQFAVVTSSKRILDNEDIVYVPESYRTIFEEDVKQALRDRAGVFVFD